jgi:PAS domain S-box-containing protein
VWLLRTAPSAELRGRSRTSPGGGAGGLLRLESGSPLFSVDRDLRIVTWNPAAEHLIGVSAPEALGRRCWEVLEGTDAEGREVCHAACAHALGLWAGEPEDVPELLVSTVHGKRRVALSTLGVTAEGQQVLVHTLRDAGPTPAAGTHAEQRDG